MTMPASIGAKIPTDSPQLVRRSASRIAGRPELTTESPQPRRGAAGKVGTRAKKAGGPARPTVLAAGTGRESVRGGGEVIELECGVSVYPARSAGGRWRAVWYEAGERRQCEAATEAKMAPKLEKVIERLQADAPNMRRPGADLIAHYLDLDRLPVRDRWSRKHADTQRRLCERFAAPFIGAVMCQDIKTEHIQKIVNSAPTAGEGDRVHRMVSALVTAGIDAGYLTCPRLARVHWQAGDRPLPAPVVSVAGESGLWVDPAEIPSAADVGALGAALGAGRRGDLDELMAYVAAYSGLRWGRSPPSPLRRPARPRASSPSTARSSRLAGGCISRRRRTASSAGRSTRGARPAAIPWLSCSRPGSKRPARSRSPGATRWGSSSPGCDILWAGDGSRRAHISR